MRCDCVQDDLTRIPSKVTSKEQERQQYYREQLEWIIHTLNLANDLANGAVVLLDFMFWRFYVGFGIPALNWSDFSWGFFSDHF